MRTGTVRYARNYKAAFVQEAGRLVPGKQEGHQRLQWCWVSERRETSKQHGLACRQSPLPYRAAQERLENGPDHLLAQLYFQHP